jgi:uncharacterized protein (UPF0276 family)
MMGAGIAPKPQHYASLLADPHPPAFIEVHAENFLGAGGEPHASLRALRDRFPLSLHGVGLSIGGEAPLDVGHVERIAALIERYQPDSFSEHLAWSSHGLNNFNDLLPLVYDQASLDRVCRHVDQLQTRFGRRILLENPATYVEFAASSIAEGEFLGEVVRRTGCGLLLDVNNAYVNSINHGRDPVAYLASLPLHAAGQVHLSGHAVDSDALGAPLLIDSHGSEVADAVWRLYAHALESTGPLPTLIEWDNDVPAYTVLRDQARQAQMVLDACRRSAA